MMAILDKYNLLTSPPKISRERAAKDLMNKVRRNFIAGLDKQLKQAKAWKPGAKDARSWVVRDVDRNEAYVTVKYGPWPVPIKGTKKSTIGPIKLDKIQSVFEDIRKAFEAGELDAGLKKVAIRGPRKKSQQRSKKAA